MCSEETVRRDLKELESQGLLKRIHGGAYIENYYEKGVPITLRDNLFANEKERLAEFIVSNFIHKGDTIMLDSSTTCTTIAKQILALNSQVTIITNSLRIANLFDNITSNTKIICLGGVLDSKTSSFDGPTTIDGISHFIADKSFISSAAIDAQYGILDNTITGAATRKAFLTHSRQKFYVGDNTKFLASADIIISNLSELNHIITTDSLPEIWNTVCANSNISIHYC